MKQKVISFVLSVFALCMIAVPAAASDELPMVIDQAGLLSYEEIATIEDISKVFRNSYEMDIVILTVDSLSDHSAQYYADTFFDDNGYGYGNQRSGILFLLAMEEREWYISTSGEAIYALTDYSIQQLGEAAVYYLSSGNYYDGFIAYLTTLQTYLDAYHLGISNDGYKNHSVEYAYNIKLSLFLGVIAATISIIVMRSSMNTKRMQRGASEYMKSGSYRLHTQQDLFLYSNISKTRREESKSSSGGSSCHRSSSGNRHGGGGGKF